MHVAEHILDDNKMMIKKKLIWLQEWAEIGTVEQIKTPCLKLKTHYH